MKVDRKDPDLIRAFWRFWTLADAGYTDTVIEIEELWTYRRRFDWRSSLRREFPDVWPFRGRARSDDVVVAFDGEGNVSAITAGGALIVGPEVLVDD